MNELDLTEQLQFITFQLGEISEIAPYLAKAKPYSEDNLLFPPLFSLHKNSLHNEVWGCAEILLVIIF